MPEDVKNAAVAVVLLEQQQRAYLGVNSKLHLTDMGSLSFIEIFISLTVFSLLTLLPL